MKPSQNYLILFLIIAVIFLTGCERINTFLHPQPELGPLTNLSVLGVDEDDSIQVYLGRSIKFEVSGTDSDGQSYSVVTPRWSVKRGSNAITSNGIFQATKLGRTVVEAVVENIKTQITIDVFHPHILGEIYSYLLENSYYENRIPMNFSSLTGSELNVALFAEYGSPKKLIASLQDPYSRWLVQNGNSSGILFEPDYYEGVGINIYRNRDGKIVVAGVLPETPASRAGIQKNDIIHAIDALSTRGLDVEDVVALIRGSAGTQVKLMVTRSGNSLEFDLTREKIVRRAAYGKLLERNIGYITIHTFLSSKVTDEFLEIYRSLPKPLHAMIIDLRGNGGGFLSSALSLADLLVPAGVEVIHIKSREGDETYRAKNSNVKIQVNSIVLLVDGGTASASEIITAALLDNGLATVIGEKTVGKGSIQNNFSLSDDSSALLTIGEFLSPKNNLIHGVGIIPSQVVSGDEAQLQAALDVIHRNAGITIQSLIRESPLNAENFNIQILTRSLLNNSIPLNNDFQEWL